MNYGVKPHTLIKLLRKGLDCKEKSDLLLEEWNLAMTFAFVIAYDGMEKALDSNSDYWDELPKSLLLQW